MVNTILNLIVLFFVTLPILFALYILLPTLAKVLLRNRFLRLTEGSKQAYLTFDDGPDPKVTPKLLEVLNKAGVKVTFFVVGKKAEAYPDLITSMIEMGHEIGEHTQNHYFPWTSGPIRAAKDLWGCARVLDTLQIARKERLFRPPYGKLNLVGLAYILIMRRRVAFWSVDPRDYIRETGAKVASIVARDLAPGAVVLLHDGTTNFERSSGTPVVVEALKEILDHAINVGITFTTLGSSIEKDVNIQGKTP